MQVRALIERVFSRQAAVRDGDLTSPGHTELLADDVAVRLGGARRDAKSVADFLVRAAGGDESDDFALAGGELRPRLSHE